MSIFIFPPLDKKILDLIIYIVLGSFFYSITSMIGNYSPTDNEYLDSLSQFFIYIPFFIYSIYIKCKKHKKENEQKNYFLFNIIKTNESYSKFKIKDYIILIFILILSVINNIFISIYSDNEEASSLFNGFSIQMLVLFLLSKYNTNSGYYRHQLVSLSIVTLLSIIIDVILITTNDDYKSKDWLYYIITLMLDTIEVYYQKYLFEIKALTIPYVSSLFGIINFISLSIVGIIQIKFDKKFLCMNDECKMIFNFEISTIENKIILFVSFILNSFYYLCFFKILYHFSPIHYLFCYATFLFITNFQDVISSDNIFYIVIYCIFFIIIAINLLVYLEILELNFCNLNKYTRRNIMAREVLEIMDISSIEEDKEEEEEEKEEKNKRESKIEIDENYYIYTNDDD